MLDANLKKQLDTYLQHIVNPIEISVSVDESPKGKELHELAVEIAGLIFKRCENPGKVRGLVEDGYDEGNAPRERDACVFGQGRTAREVQCHLGF